jgi:hypothetical protein
MHFHNVSPLLSFTLFLSNRHKSHDIFIFLFFSLCFQIQSFSLPPHAFPTHPRAHYDTRRPDDSTHFLSLSPTAPSANLAPVFNYPVPTLTLGGELDGLTRVTRIAESFYQCEKQQIGIQQFPVIVLPGVSHFQV